MSGSEGDHPADDRLRVRSDFRFYAAFCSIGGSYILLIVAMVAALAVYTTPGEIKAQLDSPEIRYAIWLTLVTCSISTLISVWVAVPIGYLMSRHKFRGQTLIDAVLDLPIALPPLVVGVCLLVLFYSPVGNWIEGWLHALESFVSNHLAPIACLLLLVLAAGILFGLLRRVIPRKRIRLTLLAVIVAVAFPALTSRHLFPSMPAWLSLPEDFTQVDVTFRDQKPLWPSRHVYSARYRIVGTGDEMIGQLEQRLSQDANVELKSMRRPANGDADANEFAVSARFQNVSGSVLSSGDLDYVIRPEQSLEALESEGKDWKTDSIAWAVQCDVLRDVEHSKGDFLIPLTFDIAYAIPGVILAQFMVACAFAVRTMRVTFSQIDPRFEQVAMTLGCNRSQAFWRVVFPQTRHGLLAAGTLAWARSLGEFGPILIFAGTTPFKTEVLSSAVYLQFSTANLSGAVAASLMIISMALVILIVARMLGVRRLGI